MRAACHREKPWFSYVLDPSFDRKLHSFYDEVSKLLDESLRDGQLLGAVAPGDTLTFAHLTLGALKELFYQVVIRDSDHSEEKIVREIFNFLRGGYLRMDPAAAREEIPLKTATQRGKRA